MSNTRSERIARELKVQWPNESRWHYVVIVSKEGVAEMKGPSGERVQALLGELLAHTLNLDEKFGLNKKTVFKRCDECQCCIVLEDFERHKGICEIGFRAISRLPTVEMGEITLKISNLPKPSFPSAVQPQWMTRAQPEDTYPEDPTNPGEALQTLAEFARTAPGRRPTRVEKALQIADAHRVK